MPTPEILEPGAAPALPAPPRRGWVPLAVAATVAGLVVGGVAVAASRSDDPSAGGDMPGVGRGPGTGSTPEPLALAGVVGPAVDLPMGAPAPAPVGSGAGADGDPGGGYVVRGDLPTGVPADTPVWWLASGPGERARVQALADALGAGDVEPVGDGWQASGGLVVDGGAGQAWSWSPCVLPSPPEGAGQGGGAVGCAVAEPARRGPMPSPTGPGEDAVRAAAAPVLAALGVDPDARVTVTAYDGGGSVQVEPRVGGLPTSGFSTGLGVAADGTLNGASGYLALPEEGAAYPLVDARTALDRLPPMAYAMICRMRPDGSCAPPRPVHITGAELGLSWQPLVDGRQALVPSWLYTTDTGGVLAAVALAPDYLAAVPTPSPAPVPLGGGTDPGAVSSGSGVAPAPPETSPAR